ncbi:hypothetical protein D3C77_551810 [compost metagenome]
MMSSNGNPIFDKGQVSVIAPPVKVKIKPGTAKPIDQPSRLILSPRVTCWLKRTSISSAIPVATDMMVL